MSGTGTGAGRGTSYRRYRCGRGKYHDKCDLLSVNADRLERRIVDALFSQVLTDDALATRNVRALAGFDDRSRTLEAQRDAVIAQRVEARKRIDRLVDAIEGGEDTGVLVLRLREREHDIRELDAQLRSIDESMKGQPEFDVSTFREELRTAIEEGPERARPLLRRLIDTILVDQDRVQLRYYLPPLARPTDVSPCGALGNA